MLQTGETTDSKHKMFVQRVVALDKVWGLSSDDGWAISTSTHSEDEDGTQLEVLPFWSDKAYAKAVTKDDWIDYKPVSIDLPEFMENWLVGMHNDQTLAGTNWDAELCGKEIEPLLLALELIDQLRASKKPMRFQKYKDLNDFEKQVREAIVE